MNGILSFLCSEDARAQALRKFFVFKLVPMINPDGVYRGHHRHDTNGKNLNRFYNNCIIEDHPSIWAIVQYLKYISGPDFFSYLDLHAHAGKSGIFVYGNYFTNFLQQLESCIFPKLTTINCKNFDFDNSIFSEKQMKAKDKSDGMSKEGCGRVAALKVTKAMYCYTVEANYYTGKNINEIPQIGLEDEYTNNHSDLYMGQAPDFDPGVLADCGRALLISYLDLIECNPLSRLRQSAFQSLLQLRISIAEKLITQLPYRLYSYLRKMQSNKQHLTKYIQTGKVDPECFPCFSNEEPTKTSKKKKHKSRTRLPQLITKKTQETSNSNAQNQNLKNAKVSQRQINTIAVHLRKNKNSNHIQNNKSITPSLWNVVLQKRKSNKG